MSTRCAKSVLVVFFTLGAAVACSDNSNGGGGSGGTGGSATGGSGGRGGSGGSGGSATGGTGGSATGGTGGSATGGTGGSATGGTGGSATGGTGGSATGGTGGSADDAGPSEGGTDAGADTGTPGDTAGEAGGGEAGSGNAMSFFVTSTGSGAMGGNLGGLAGADAKCEMLAAAVGAGGKGWKAYLSTNMPPVSAKDRIGTGPWRNQKGQMVAMNVAQLLGGFPANLVFDEKGATVPGNVHDIITGTQVDGTPFANQTCSDWTATTGQSRVGHSDGPPAGRLSAHSSGCTEAGLRATAGAGRMYCFASMP